MLLLQLCILSLPGVRAQGITRPTPVGQQDTLVLTDTDSLTLSAPKGDIETTIKYSARDSILFEVESKIVHLYGNAKINYGTITLEAAYIEINYETATLNATTLPDSTGKETGTPIFVDGAEKYAAKRIAYNYKTKKGHISEVVTQQGEGYIHGEVVKRNSEEQISVLHARYTTCNLEHPHFYINADRIIAQPGKKVLSGPFNLVIGDIPTPLGFLFGLFPQPKSNRASGVLVPTFGESRAQGFYLQNGGYYFAWNDYIGTSLTGDIYSLGGFNIRAANNYVKRYSYTGSLNVDYRYFKNDEADVAEGSRSTSDIRSQLPPSSRSIWLSWTHSPTQKPGRGRFSASVNAGSTIHQRVNYNSTSEFLSPTFNSNITYQKNIQNTPFSYTAKLSQGQTSSLRGKGIMNFVLPDLNFSMTPISFYEIFSKNTPTGQWYENFTIGYNVTASNKVSNLIPATGSISGGTGSVAILGGNLRSDTLDLNSKNLSELWKNGSRSASHNLSIGLGSFKLLKYFNLSPSVSYQETWLDNKFTYTFDPDSQKVRVDTTNFGRVYNYSAGASLSTTLYGTAYIKGKKIEAIRHLVRPSISYSYRPDFGNDRFGFYQNTLIGSNETTLRPEYASLPRFNSNMPGYGLQSSLNFTLNNQIEMKVKSKSDSTAKKFEKVSLIDGLNLTGSYNFAADSFQLSYINVNMNTRLFKVINLSFNSTFDPYQIGPRTFTSNNVETVRYVRINEYEFDFSKLKFARLTNANLNISANLNPASRDADRQPTPPTTNLPSMQPGMDPLNPLQPRYIDFKIPWTLNVDFTLNYAKANTPGEENRIDKTVGVDGSLNLTDKWKIAYNASYNFRDRNIANANLNIHRDLHCWEMSIGWVPFGYMQGYNVTINARSALLRDLRLTRNRSGFNR